LEGAAVHFAPLGSAPVGRDTLVIFYATRSLYFPSRPSPAALPKYELIAL